MKYFAEVIVTLKNGVRDPQGAAVDTVLRRTGMETESEVKVGKYFTLNVNAENEKDAKEKINRISEDVLSNPILESYTIGRLQQL